MVSEVEEEKQQYQEKMEKSKGGKKMGRGFCKADIKEKGLDKIMKEAKMVYSFSILCAHLSSFFAMLRYPAVSCDPSNSII